MYRTISIKIKPTKKQQGLLLQTSKEFTNAFNSCVNYGWDNNTTSMRKIHDATYYLLRVETKLPADILIQARQKACEVLRSLYQRRRKRKKVSKPISKFCPIRYNKKSSRIDFVNKIASLSTLQGRIKIILNLCKFHQQFINGKYCSLDLIYRKSDWFLNIVLGFTAPKIKTTTDCVGIDLGINRLAVTSRPKFYSSKHLHSLVAKHQHLRSDLQSKRSKSARKKLKKISGHWRRLQKNVNHIISKDIVNACCQEFGIALEDLTNIRETAKQRKKQRGKFHNWGFYQLRQFIEYKAEAKRIPVLFVNPRNTSKTCSHCGHISPRNRKSQSLFICESCGIGLNADYNASQNIRQLGISLLSSLSVNQRNVGDISSADKLTTLAVGN